MAAYFSFSKKLAGSSDWKATVTPLASIMGSGFLVSAPLLAGVVGHLALFFMAGLLILAYLVGDAIRFNIHYFEPLENASRGAIQEIAFVSRVVLSAAFVLGSFGIQNGLAAHSIASSLLVVIGGIGIWRGLDELEKVERFAVSLNLGVIAALLLALLFHNGKLMVNGVWSLAPLSTGIYLVFIALATVLFHDGLGSDVTAIIEMTKPVALIHPLLLGVAAIGSQFSAAVADNSGAGA